MVDLKASKEANPIRVLHVDDDASLRDILKLILLDLDCGFEIDQASCVEEALNKLAVGSYDIVVSDYEMPQKNGLQFLTELRQQKNDIPFILFTGKGREEVAVKALNLGADGYFNKQGSPETVYGELAHGIQTSYKNKKADELLRKSQAELNAIVCNAPIGIATSDSNMMFKSANLAFCRIVGYSEDDLQKLSFKDITYPEDVEVSNKDMKELSCGNIPYFIQEKRYVRKDGSIVDGKVIVNAIRNNQGKPVLFVAEIEDITQSKQAEAELRRTFSVLERVGEGIDAGLAIIGKDYRVIWANKRLMDLGFTPNKKCYQTINPSESVCEDCGVKKIFEQNASFDIHEYKTVNLRGETVWVELRATPLKDKQGNVTAAIELAVPITEHRRNQVILKKKEQELENILDSSPTIVFHKDLNGKFIQANKAFAQALNTTKEYLLGKTVFDIYSANIAQEMTYDDNVVLESKTPKLNIVESYESSTGLRWIRTHKIPTFDEKGEVTGLVGFSEEITDYKKTESNFKESLNDYHNLINGMVETAWVIDFAGNFLEANDAAVEVLGYSKDELLSIGILGIDKHLSRLQVQELINNLIFNKKQIFETIHTRKDGVEIPVEISSSLITYQGKQMILSIARNITERKKAQEAIKQSDQHYYQLFMSMNELFQVVEVIHDNSGKAVDLVYREVNPAFERFTGKTKRLLVDKSVRDLFGVVEAYWLEFLDKVARTGESCVLENYGASLDKYYEVHAWKIREKENLVAVLLNETTERKKAEKELKEYSEKIQMMNEKLRVVGGMTRHDVGNKLMVAKSNLYLLKKQIGMNPQLAKYLDNIDGALVSSDKIFEFSHLYEKIGGETPSIMDVFECFSQAVALFPNLGSVKVVNECGGLIVMADSLLSQVFYNLIDNSLKYGEKVSQIRLHYSKDSETLKLFYEDNGVGVSEDNKSKIFNAGFTTGRSSGLGLSLIKKIIEFYGWTITEEGEAGKGAKFVISIPKLVF